MLEPGENIVLSGSSDREVMVLAALYSGVIAMCELILLSFGVSWLSNDPDGVNWSPLVLLALTGIATMIILFARWPNSYLLTDRRVVELGRGGSERSMRYGEIEGVEHKRGTLQVRDRSGKVLMLRYLREARLVQRAITARAGGKE